MIIAATTPEEGSDMSAGPAKSHVRGVAVRDRLLAVATDLFTSAGARSTGVDEIVARSGIAKSSLYRWFPTKDDLVIAFLQQRNAAFWEQWDAVREAHRDDAAAELEAQLTWISNYIGGPRFRGCPFLNTTAEYADPDHAVRASCRANKAELRRRLADLSVRLGAPAPDELADQLLLVIDGAFADSQVFGDDGPHAMLVKTGRALVAAAVASR
jgi:AcrR family transcriptional regulator